MMGDRWCPRCQGYKHPAEAVCLACGITARPCGYCGVPLRDHSRAETAYCTGQAAALARLAESTTATQEG